MKGHLLLLALFIVGVACQSTNTNIATTDALDDVPVIAHEIVNLIPKPLLFCRLTQTATVLGYLSEREVIANPFRIPNLRPIPIYQNKCTGICISLIAQPRECRPKYRRIFIASKPYGPLDKWVLQVVGCECTPKRCAVTSSTGATTYYENGATVYDKCDHKCTCSYGKLINCCRQRKEFRLGMTHAERVRYINAVKVASTTAPYKTTYDNLINMHEDLFPFGIHGGSAFLPWHRWYILQLENLLRLIDCRVTVPYWDWSKEAASPWTSIIWGPSYLGGAGVSSSSPAWCVPNGPFGSPAGWTIPSGGCLKRSMLGSVGTVAFVTGLITGNPLPSDFNSFRSSLEGIHGSVHCAIGQTMCTVAASSDPIFFLHHGFIDKIWGDWQSQSAAHVTAWSGSAASYTSPMQPQAPHTVPPGVVPATPQQMADLNNQYMPDGSIIRVCQINPPQFGVWWDVLVNSDILVNARATAAFQPAFDNSTAGQVNIRTWVEPMKMPEALGSIQRAEAVLAARAVLKEEEVKASNDFTQAIGVEVTDDTLDRIFSDSLVSKGCLDTEDENADDSA